jgi:hypothetical protein
MAPIYLQEQGIGFGYSQFIDYFRKICESHIKEKRATQFAFVFYNMTDRTISNALNSENGFNRINDVSGNEVTIFYLHDSASGKISESFNKKFLKELRINDQANLPCIAFFRIYNENLEDISIHSIDQNTNESFMVIEQICRIIKKEKQNKKKEGNISALTDVLKIPFEIFMKKISKM